MNKELITRREAAAMRGLAILAIVLHNYTHWLTNGEGERVHLLMA